MDCPCTLSNRRHLVPVRLVRKEVESINAVKYGDDERLSKDIGTCLFSHVCLRLDSNQRPSYGEDRRNLFHACNIRYINPVCLETGIWKVLRWNQDIYSV